MNVRIIFLLLCAYVINANVCPDGCFCYEIETCCPQSISQDSDDFGCCPYPNAVCCSDQHQCCPSDHICIATLHICIGFNRHLNGTPTLKISTTEILQRTTSKKPEIAKIKHQSCGTNTCPDYSTCCGNVSCCPLSTGTCCTDNEHCCPGNTICCRGNIFCCNGDTDHAVLKSFGEIQTFNPTKYKDQQDQPCGSSFCPDNYTCCEEAGCCPFPDAVCCSDQLGCCPNHTTCDPGGLGCLTSNAFATYSTKAETFDLKKPIYKSCGRISCPESYTCCDNFRCCKYPNAVCSEDGLHCCPQNTKCDPKGRGCLNPDFLLTSVKELNMTYFKTTKDHICGTGICSDNSTCCGDFACCLTPEAVCCEDNEHCCPHGWKCNLEMQACVL